MFVNRKEKIFEKRFFFFPVIIKLLALLYEHVWKYSANHVSKKFNFFLLKFNIIYMFLIVLIC